MDQDYAAGCHALALSEAREVEPRHSSHTLDKGHPMLACRHFNRAREDLAAGDVEEFEGGGCVGWQGKEYHAVAFRSDSERTAG